MTSSCCTIVDRKDHVQYLQFQRSIPDDCMLGQIRFSYSFYEHNKPGTTDTLQTILLIDKQ